MRVGPMNTRSTLLFFALISTGLAADCAAYDANGIALNRGAGDLFVLEIDRSVYDRMNCVSASDCAPLRALVGEKLKREKPCPGLFTLSPPNTAKEDRIRHFGKCATSPATVVERRQPQSSGNLSGQITTIQPQGAYAAIDTRPATEMMRRLGSSLATDRNAAIDEVLAKPSEQMPPVFYALANALAREAGRMEEAIFWYHVGRLRAVYDAQRCRDETARQAVGVLGMGLSQELRKSQLANPDRVLSIAKKAIEWDAAHAHAYDHRWINLHGLRAQNPSDAQSPLTAPEGEWSSILAKVHSEHLKSVDSFAAAGKRP